MKRGSALVLALALCTSAMLWGTSRARADARFGDSIWVAPGVPIAGDAITVGGRVAAPDHERGWETALRLPFRVAFFPLRAVTLGLEAAASRYGDGIYERSRQHSSRSGFGIAPAFNIGALNDIGVGPTLSWAGFPTADATLDLGGTWSAIDRRRVGFSGTIHDHRQVGLRLTAHYDYKPNHRYYGIGNDTPEGALSYFRLESTDAAAAILLGASPLKQLRLIGGYSGMSPARGYNASPLLEDLFPSGVPYARIATQELSYGIRGDLAVLDDPRDPSFGAHGRVELQRATEVHDRDHGYDRWLLEGRAYVPVFARRRVFAVRCVYRGVRPTGGSVESPFYRLASSEGDTRFAGYPTDRFRDRQLALARIEYRWTILQKVSALALYELGAVAARSSGLTLPAAHRSYGGGLRLGVSEQAAMRIEFANSADGQQTTLRLSSDF